MTDLKCLTTKEVARLCRVSDATVKRWQEAGLLQSERTSGGHRRFRPEEIARFQQRQGLGLKQCHGDETVTAVSSRPNVNKIDCAGSAFLHSLLVGCEEAAANILISANLQNQSPTKIFDDLICPAMRQIGELWADGKISVTQEHLASRIAQNAVYKLRQTLPVSKTIGKLAVCCALEGDFHELPTHLTQMTLENEGWEVINFGANTPLGALGEEISNHKPDLICISGAVLSDTESLCRDYQKFSKKIVKLKIPVVLGGRIFNEKKTRAFFPADFYAQKFADVVRIAQALAN